MWSPLAMADLYAAVVALIRVMAANPDAVKVPKRSDVLAAWCLPMLSKSVAADEEERKAIELLKSVERLKNRVEGAKNRRERLEAKPDAERPAQ